MALVLGAGMYIVQNPPRHPPCCVDESATVTQQYEAVACGKYSCYNYWVISYHVWAARPPGVADWVIGTNATTSARCSYYQVGMNLTLNRNVQPDTLPFGGFGIAANNTNSGFTTVVGAPQGC